MRLFRKLGSDTHPDTGRALDTLGKILGDLGQRDEAIRTLTTAMTTRAAALGEGHPDTAETKFALAGLLYTAGEHRQHGLHGCDDLRFVDLGHRCGFLW